MNKHDVVAIARFYADSALIQSPNLEATEFGPKGAKNIYERYFTTSPDMAYTITRILPGDSSVTIEYTFAGTMQHLESTAPTYMLNKYYSIKSCTVLEIRNGKIVADISYFDQVAFLRQVGFFDKQ
ncbi:MAG: nuclear transport factor 2 family protein [Sediminibacterium sp.]